ncbi:Tim17 domain-containing protein [Cephalotus follicularis]|uniref:Tim17 domain-containing protein n=1 Tax=Cephalotus follicularis TaxID=3775 RepID=A0A1Q3BS66_CEPFO|nr:Tim17 domain-containing protein [Cephalotus follicularis]
MASSDKKPREGETPQSQTASSSPFTEDWKAHILIPTVVAGIVGGGIGLVSKYRKVHGIANISQTYATNLAIVAGCYCGAREFVRITRKSEPDDLLNSAIAGFGTGALLGRLQGGQRGAVRYSVIFAFVGTTVDYATLRLKPVFRSFREKIDHGLKFPEWSPIQILDEEALAAKRAREQQLYAQRGLGKLNKEES